MAPGSLPEVLPCSPLTGKHLPKSCVNPRKPSVAAGCLFSVIASRKRHLSKQERAVAQVRMTASGEAGYSLAAPGLNKSIEANTAQLRGNSFKVHTSAWLSA